MADYSIPWKPLDLTPGLSMLIAVNKANAQDERANAYLEMEKKAVKDRADRESAAIARQKKQDDYIRRKEAFNALPALYRAAHKSVGMANANPYGVKFDETVEAPDQAKADDEVSRFLAGPRAPEMMPEQSMPAARQLLPNEEGPEQDPAAEAARFASTDSLMDDATTGAPMDLMTQAAANAMGKSTRRLQATYQGQRFDVPEQNDTLGLGDEYDTIYRNLLASGEDEDAARKYVLSEHKSDRTQKSIADRTASQIDARREEALRSRPDVATQEDWLMRRLNQSDINSRRGAAARVASAGTEFKQEGVNDRLYGLLDRRIKQVKDTAQYGKLAAENKTVRSIMSNIASGSVPLQHADAQISLARFFRQAQPTEGEMHMLYSNLGGTADKWNQFVARISKGDLSAEQMRQLKAAAKSVHHEHQENLKRFQAVATKGLGPGNGLDLIPDQAQHAYEMLGAELGMEDPGALYSTEGGITLGSGQAPRVQPRGAKKTELDQIEEALDRLGGGGGR